MNPSFQPVGPPMQGAPPVRALPAPPPPAGSGISLDDIYYTLFRHKWKILLCSIAGLLGAAVWITYRPTTYHSEAKLFIRYVLFEGMAQSPATDDIVMKSPDRGGETIMNSEQEILTSLDLARQVAQTIGPAKILAKAGGGDDLNAAAIVISHGLTAEVSRYSSVLNIGFQGPDVTLVQPVLQELVTQYLKRHVEIHRAAGLVGDFLAQETDQLRARLAQTEDDLRKAEAKAGVISVEEAKKSYSDGMASVRQQIFEAQAEFAERSAMLQQFVNSTPKPSSPSAASPAGGSAVTATAPAAAATGSAPAATAHDIPASVQDEYRLASTRLDSLRKREQDLLLQFTGDNSMVKDVRTQIAEAQASKQKLESTYPGLIRNASVASPAGPAPSNPTSGIDVASETAHLNALQARIKTLNDQMDSLRAGAANLESMEGTIQELKRQQELQEANYRRYSASLEQSRINEALGSGKVSNISMIQAPTPPFVDSKNALKIPGGIAAGGVAAGLAWAFLIELVLDRTVRRSGDIEKKLGLPLFLSIPHLVMHRPRRLFRWPGARRSSAGLASGDGVHAGIAAAGKESAGAELVPWDRDNILRPFHETLRDRLIGYFERRNLTHKPKLVAVTGIGADTGVTTTAAGLASCLSETGEGNVLLVDLTPGQGSAQHFYRGDTVCDLDDLSANRDSAQVQDKLYVVSDNRGTELLSRVLPQRFKSLVPRLKASDFDYIIFDMPPVSQISITPRLAGFMDMVLLVMESEKTSLDLVQRATALLAETNAHVGAVLNKRRTYVPAMINQEDLGN